LSLCLLVDVFALLRADTARLLLRGATRRVGLPAHPPLTGFATFWLHFLNVWSCTIKLVELLGPTKYTSLEMCYAEEVVDKGRAPFPRGVEVPRALGAWAIRTVM
jgi:hypothetical protein